MFNEIRRKTEWTRSDGWFHRSSRFLSCNWSSNPRCMVNDMLVIAASMIGGFIFAALLTDGNVDDDDNGPGRWTDATRIRSHPLTSTTE